MPFIVDYSLDDGETITREEYPDSAGAERRARNVSKKHHKGGYTGPLVYVFHKFSPRGQRTFFAGRTDDVEKGYLLDRSELE